MWDLRTWGGQYIKKMLDWEQKRVAQNIKYEYVPEKILELK